MEEGIRRLFEDAHRSGARRRKKNRQSSRDCSVAADVARRAFASAEQRLEMLWAELRLPDRERTLLRDRLSALTGISRAVWIREHTAALLEHRAATLRVLRDIASRECIVQQLGELRARVNSAGATDDNAHSSSALDAEVRKRVPELLRDAKTATVAVAGSVRRWRRGLHDPRRPFLWRTINYMGKCASDLAWLGRLTKSSALKARIEDKCDLLSRAGPEAEFVLVRARELLLPEPQSADPTDSVESPGCSSAHVSAEECEKWLTAPDNDEVAAALDVRCEHARQRMLRARISISSDQGEWLPILAAMPPAVTRTDATVSADLASPASSYDDEYEEEDRKHGGDAPTEKMTAQWTAEDLSLSAVHHD